MVVRLGMALALLGAPAQQGSFEYVAHALSEAANTCAASPGARTYLSQTIPHAFESAWSHQPRASGGSDFTVELRFSLDAGAKPTHVELGTAAPRAAGVEVLTAFQSAVLPPLP